MNKHRVKLLHITYLGHYELEVPYACKQLAYCHEHGSKNHTAHTHILVELQEPETKAKVIKEMSKNLKVHCQLNVVPHFQFTQMIAYHYGLKDFKARCIPGPVWKTPFDYDAWIKNRFMQRAYSPQDQAVMSKLLENTPLDELVDQGYVSFYTIKRYQEAKQLLSEVRSVRNYQTLDQRIIYFKNEQNEEWIRILCNQRVKKRHF